MTVLQQQVSHEKFGTGLVTAQTEKFVTVEFDAPYGTKTFLCPTAFAQFLTLTDASVNTQMQQELQQIKLQADAIRRQREEEEQTRLAAARIAALAAKKKATAAKRAATRKANAKKV